MTRLFVGLELSPLLQESLSYARGGVHHARWQRDDQLHLTLAFLGEVSRRQMLEVEDALASIDFSSFDLTLTGVDSFGKPGQPKALWAGVENEKPLIHLHKKILKAMEDVGVAVDRRRYKPHVTLARFPRGTMCGVGDWVSENGDLRSPTQQVSYFTLFSSALTREGPCYSVEARFAGIDAEDLIGMDYEFGPEVFA